MNENNQKDPQDPAQRFETFLRRLEEARRRLAYDALTGLFNWSTGVNFVEQRLEHTDPLSISLIKIIRFKAVNQTYGRKAGDDLLRRMAMVLMQISTPTRDFPCRWSGSGFLLASPEQLDGLELAYRIGQSRPWTRFGTPDIAIKVAHSVPGDTVETLVARAQP